jgi:hypothetical protein
MDNKENKDVERIRAAEVNFLRFSRSVNTYSVMDKISKKDIRKKLEIISTENIK